MSDFVIGMMFAVGVSGWVFGKSYAKTGSNVKQTLMISSVAFILAFLAMLTALHYAPSI